MLIIPLMADSARLRTPLVVVAIPAIICFCGLTYSRNLIWRDPVTLWENNRFHLLLARIYRRRGNAEEAESYLYKAGPLRPLR